jgi:hypothetical protein
MMGQNNENFKSWFIVISLFLIPVFITLNDMGKENEAPVAIENVKAQDRENVMLDDCKKHMGKIFFEAGDITPAF